MIILKMYLEIFQEILSVVWGQFRFREFLVPAYTPFQGLSYSGSGSWVLHKGTDLVGPEFCALPRCNQLRQPGAWRAHSPQVGGASYHLPGPSRLVSWVCSGSVISGVLCVSSGELISGCSPPGRCQPSRIPGRLG